MSGIYTREQNERISMGKQRPITQEGGKLLTERVVVRRDIEGHLVHPAQCRCPLRSCNVTKRWLSSLCYVATTALGDRLFQHRAPPWPLPNMVPRTGCGQQG